MNVHKLEPSNLTLTLETSKLPSILCKDMLVFVCDKRNKLKENPHCKRSLLINTPKLNSVMNMNIKLLTNNKYDQSNGTVNADRDFARLL